MSTFNQCIANGSYQTVSPGEFCSLETAKKLGIHDAMQYYNPEYKDLKTFNNDKDAADGRKTEICSETKDGKTAYQMCVVEHGMGFVRKPAYPNKCVTVGCPPGFVSERGECKKPLEDYAVSKRARCDERWYDWFLVPNYHLGNKYYSPKAGECYKPCPAYTVPQFEKDPVDDSSAGYNVKEQLNKCVPRDQYISGKYLEGSDYCPVAWVYRLAGTPSVINEQIIKKLDEVQDAHKPENMNASHEKLRLNATNEAKQVAIAGSELIQNVTPPNDNMAVACQNLNTDERLEFAYDVCERLADDDTWYAQKLEEEMGDGEQLQREKTKMLKQACNALFCSSTNSANEQIGKAQVCIPGVMPVQPIEEEKEITTPPSSQGGQNFLMGSIRFAYMIVLAGIFGTMVILFIVYFLYPKILVPIYRWLKNLFSRHKESDQTAMLIDKSNAKV